MVKCMRCGCAVTPSDDEASEWMGHLFCGRCSADLNKEVVIPATDHFHNEVNAHRRDLVHARRLADNGD